MDEIAKFKSIEQIINYIKDLYFKKGTDEVCFWIKHFHKWCIPDKWQSKLDEYIDSDVLDETLCIHLIGNKGFVISVTLNGCILIWRVKKCS